MAQSVATLVPVAALKPACDPAALKPPTNVVNMAQPDRAQQIDRQSTANVAEGKERENSIYDHLSSTQPRSQKLGVICGLSLLLVFVLALTRGFSPGTSPVFSSPQKPTFPNSISIWIQWTKSHLAYVPPLIPICLCIHL